MIHKFQMYHQFKILNPACSSCVPRRGLNLRPRSIFGSRRVQSKPPYRHIVQLGDPVLRVQCEPVEPSLIRTKEVQEVIQAMKFAINRFDGVGLSAPQIGVPLQIMVVQITNRQLKFWSEEIQKRREMEAIPMKIIINPKLNILDNTQVVHTESCNSMHGFSALVPRSKKVELSALDEEGKMVRWSPSGWSARILQHEFDHLQGKMFIDRALPESLSFDYWKIVNNRQGNFRLPFDGIKPGVTKFMSGFFRQK